MPYEVRTDLALPPDETVIWRYMDLPKLLMLLEQKALYFALVKELGDSWEAVMARRVTESIAHVHGPAASGDIVNLFRSFPSIVGVNCWYQGRGESVAMWNLYTTKSYGLAIKSTVGRLKQAFRLSHQSVTIGKILYEDHQKPHSDFLSYDQLNAMMPLLQKRPCFKHEHELRALTVIQPDPSERRIPGELYPYAPPKRGTLVSVDLSTLIESITLGPDFWATPLLQSALHRAGIEPPQFESAILAPPTADFGTF